MSLTESSMLTLGSPAAPFELTDVTTKQKMTLQPLKGSKGTLIIFMCRHCPYVVHVQGKISEIARAYAPKGISTVAISSNDAKNYPDDSPDKLKMQAEKCGFTFPYLYDEDQSVARAYSAECTPDFFLFDKDLLLAYRGKTRWKHPGE